MQKEQESECVCSNSQFSEDVNLIANGSARWTRTSYAHTSSIKALSNFKLLFLIKVVVHA